MSCPMCGGPQDQHVTINIRGEWGDKADDLETVQYNSYVLRCIDCGYDEEVPYGTEKSNQENP